MDARKARKPSFGFLVQPPQLEPLEDGQLLKEIGCGERLDFKGQRVQRSVQHDARKGFSPSSTLPMNSLLTGQEVAPQSRFVKNLSHAVAANRCIM